MGVIFLIFGIILGIVAANSKINFISVLSPSNKLIFDFIKGKGQPFDIFFQKLIETALLLLIIFLFGLSIFTFWLNYIFIAYQGFVFATACFNLIYLYGVAGILNVIFLAIPINAVMFLAIIGSASVCGGRAIAAQKFNQRFWLSFKTYKFFPKFIFCAVFGFFACFLFAFVLPLLLKNFLLIAY